VLLLLLLLLLLLMLAFVLIADAAGKENPGVDVVERRAQNQKRKKRAGKW